MSKVEDYESSEESSDSNTSESDIDEKIDTKIGEPSAKKTRGRPKKPVIMTSTVSKKSKKGTIFEYN